MASCRRTLGRASRQFSAAFPKTKTLIAELLSVSGKFREQARKQETRPSSKVFSLKKKTRLNLNSSFLVCRNFVRIVLLCRFDYKYLCAPLTKSINKLRVLYILL